MNSPVVNATGELDYIIHRVEDVTTHPAFRNTARMVARLYDALHDDNHKDKILLPTETGNGGVTHAYFKAPKTVEDLLQGRSAIAEWARLTYGWLGRAPDYKASFLATLGANSDFYDPYQDNAKRWYKFSQERVPYINHAIIHPPVDRDRSAARSSLDWSPSADRWTVPVDWPFRPASGDSPCDGSAAFGDTAGTSTLSSASRTTSRG